MKLLQRLLVGLGTMLLLALSLQLVAPKAVHAVVSTLVTVANTAANPVPVHSVDSAPLVQTFQASGSCFLDSFSPNLPVACRAGNVLLVPLGMTAVVQDISGNCRSFTYDGNPAPPPAQIDVFVSGQVVDTGDLELNTVFQNATTLGGATTTTYVFGRQVTLYIPSSATAQSAINFSTVPAAATSCSVNLAGYYIPNNVTSNPINPLS
jgi:hypothetical protein